MRLTTYLSSIDCWTRVELAIPSYEVQDS